MKTEAEPPAFVSLQAVLIAHRMTIKQDGGAEGVRDLGLLESALARPRNLWEYEKADIPQMAAALIHGIVSSHPFVDGNKRAGLAAGYMFLRKNGWDLNATEPDVVVAILGAASGDLDELALTAWLRRDAART